MQYVPVQFMRECGELAHKSELILKDICGRSWPVHLFHRKRPVKYGSGTHIGNGWLQFARDNKLKAGDSCVFKLANGGEEKVLQVTILRKQEDIYAAG